MNLPSTANVSRTRQADVNFQCILGSARKLQGNICVHTASHPRAGCHGSIPPQTLQVIQLLHLRHAGGAEALSRHPSAWVWGFGTAVWPDAPPPR